MCCQECKKPYERIRSNIGPTIALMNLLIALRSHIRTILSQQERTQQRQHLLTQNNLDESESDNNSLPYLTSLSEDEA